MHDRLYSLPDSARVLVGRHHRPGGRSLRYGTTIGLFERDDPQRSEATTEEDFVRFCHERDRGLAAPRLPWASVQVNANAGRLPPPHPSGRRYLAIPVDPFAPTDEAGEPTPT